MRIESTLKRATASLVIDIAYAVYNVYLGIATLSWWFITAGAYYAVLSVKRFGVLLTARKTDKDNSADFVMRFTGFMFIFLAIIQAGTAYLSLYNTAEKYNEIVMITIALYAFTKLTLGIVKLIKSKKYNSPILRTLRNISFADGLVSIFSLQRSMLVTFDGMTDENIFLMNCLTGSGVYLLVLILGINLIGGRRVNMAKSKLVKANERIADAVVGGYKKIENGVVGAYTKIEDKFVEQYLTKDGETVEEAKERLKNSK